MAKKTKKKKPEVHKKKSKKPVLWIAGAVSAGILILFVSGNIPFSGSEDKKGKSFYVQGGETRPLLDPSLFTGMVRSAYAAAKKYPEVMDQLHCYCYCDEPPVNHKSLLSCFADRHGAG